MATSGTREPGVWTMRASETPLENRASGALPTRNGAFDSPAGAAVSSFAREEQAPSHRTRENPRGKRSADSGITIRAANEAVVSPVVSVDRRDEDLQALSPNVECARELGDRA